MCFFIQIYFKMRSKQEALRKQIYEFYFLNKSLGKKYTLDHFKAARVPRQTISDIIKRAENDSGHERVTGSGRIAKKMTKVNIKRLKTMFDHRDGISTRQAARKFKCSQPHIVKTLAKWTNITCYKKKKIPLRNDDQRERIPGCCDRLYRKIQEKSVIMDDESYFTLSHTTINSNGHFYSSDMSQTQASAKYRTVAKYEAKILVWIALSPEGMSKPYFLPSGLAINKQVYLDECIIKRLVPFINAHHSDGQYLFWPDLASAHYAKTVLDYMNKNNIHFVTRIENPPAVPECRPIENFWTNFKGKVYAKNWQAKNLDQLKAKIKKSLKEVDIDLVKSMLASTRRLVGQIRTNGLIEKN